MDLESIVEGLLVIPSRGRALGKVRAQTLMHVKLACLGTGEGHRAEECWRQLLGSLSTRS